MFYKNYRYMEDGIDYFILYGLSVAEYNLNEYYQLIEGTGYDEYLIRFDDFIDFLRIIKSY